MLLLDEPTNHLDADGRAWLAEWLAGFTGTLLTISHDRDFLDATVERVYELSADGLDVYEGGYTAYRAERERLRARLAQQVEAQEKRRRRLEADIAMTRRQAEYTERTRAPGHRPEVQALREEGGEEVQGARAPAAARDGVGDVAARAARPGRVQGAPRGRGAAGGSSRRCAV